MEAHPTSTAYPNEAIEKLYAESIEKGRRIHRKFGIVIVAAPKPSPGQLLELYQVRTGPRKPCLSLHKTLLDSNCGTKDFFYVDVQNKDDKDWSQTFYSNYSHGKDGVIVAAENFKELDKNVLGRTLFPSEVLWQSYLLATEKTGASPANPETGYQAFCREQVNLVNYTSCGGKFNMYRAQIARSWWENIP